MTNKKTSSFLTTYEKARILGLRALQIQQFRNAPHSSSSLEIAKRELNQNKLNLTIRRYLLPPHRFEDVRVSELNHGGFDRRGKEFLLQKLVSLQTKEQVHQTVDKSDKDVSTATPVSEFLPAGSRSSLDEQKSQGRVDRSSV
jgi:DNA-directed RNA polymerase subunit K/omega